MDKPIIIITGACGRIGRATAEMFSKDFLVVGLDIYVPDNPVKDVEYLAFDISSNEQVQNCFTKIKEKYGKNICSFIHLAAYYNFEGGSWEKYQKITIDGTKNILEILSEFQVEQFVFSSTMLVHEPCKLQEKISEDSPIKPKWEYPLSKAKTEVLIHDLRKSMSTVILRIAGVYNDACDSIPISQHIWRIYKKKIESHFFPGNVHHGSAFLHLEDLKQALLKVVEKRKEFSEEEVFLLGEPEVMSFQELQDTIGQLLYNKPWWTLRIPKWVAKFGAILQDRTPFLPASFIKPWMIDLADDHYDLNIKKAREVVGWEPNNALKNSLPKMIDLLKKNPEKWHQVHEF